MGIDSKREYLAAIWARYHGGGRRYRSRILDEFCKVCGYHRKHAIRLLRAPAAKPRRRRGRRRVYDDAAVAVLKTIWLASDQLCAQRLHAALPIWLPHYEQQSGPLLPLLRRQLLRMSSATINRLLRPCRAQHPRRGLSGTKPGSLLKQHIPIRTGNEDLTQPGFLEADTVAHCGDSLEGSFIWSLTVTDVHTQWTENRAVWNKGATEVLARIREIEAELPFPIRGFDVDNGSEFLNRFLWRYFFDRPEPVGFCRSRPYHKDDQAHVEQKNWTHVRQLLGYNRLADPELLPLINELYRTAWDPYHNFFRPSMKLRQKTRVRARTHKQHDQPRTPYQRLLDCPEVSPDKKRALQQQFAALNPFTLKKDIEQKLRLIFHRRR